MTIPSRLAGVNYGPLPRGFGGTLAGAPTWVIIHDTSNSASASDEAHYAASRTDDEANWTSAHFYVDTTGVIGSAMLVHLLYFLIMIVVGLTFTTRRLRALFLD